MKAAENAGTVLKVNYVYFAVSAFDLHSSLKICRWGISSSAARLRHW